MEAWQYLHELLAPLLLKCISINGYFVPVHYRISLCGLTLHHTQKWSVALHVLVTRRLSLSFSLPLPPSRSLATTYGTCNPSSPNSKAYFDPVPVPSARTGTVGMHKLVPTMPRPRPARQACNVNKPM